MIFAKNKFPNVSALVGMKAEDVTEVTLKAANDELVAAGINAAVVVSATELSEAQALVAANETLTAEVAKLKADAAEVTKLKADLATANGLVATLTTERDNFKAKADEYGSQAGEKPTSAVKKDGDQIESSDNSAQAIIDALPHNVALRNNPLFS